MPSVRIDVHIANDRGSQFASPDDHLFKVVHFEPEQNSIADGLV
jgi:hypothetical protein